MKRTSRILTATLLATSSLLAQGPDDLGPNIALAAPASVGPTLSGQGDELPPGTTQVGSRLGPLLTPIHTAADDQGLRYGIWAASDSYKASFHEGMTFVPYLGSAYPTTQSLGWTTVSARVGETELLEGMTAQPVQSDWRYEYQFGPITEAYDVRELGLEQTFVLHGRPCAGDLVIRGAVTTKLHTKNCAAKHQSLTFCDDQERAILEYGSAIAFDARGDRVQVSTAYSDGIVTLTVPGAWVERAALPITVDPLLASVNYTSGTAELETVDIGRDDEATDGNVLLVHVRSVSATDSDVYAYLRNDDFSIPAAAMFSTMVFSDLSASWSSDDCSCAFVGGADRWAIVFRRHFVNSPTQTSRLRCHVHDSGDMTLLTNVGALTPTFGLNDWRPDVGGVQSYASGNDAMVVFQREDNGATGGDFANTATSSIYGCLLDATTASGTFGTPFEIKASLSHDSERASVNQVAEGGASFSWVCVFQRYLNGVPGDDWDLQGARIAHDGTVASGSWLSDLANASPSQHQLGPVVEGTSGRYAVVFTTVDVPSVNFKTSLTTGKQVQLERFDWEHGASAPSGDKPNVALRSNPDRIWEACGLAYSTNDYSHWACSFRSVSPGSGAVYYTRVGFNGKATEGPNTVLYYVAGDQGADAACVFDNDHNAFLFNYAVNTAGVWHDTYGHSLVYEMPAAPSTFGISCSGAQLGWNGNQQIGSEFNRVTVTGAPPSAIHIMLAATVTTNVPVIHPVIFPGCRLFVMASGPGYLGSFPVKIASSTSWDLPLPEFLDPQVLQFQDWYLDANGLLYSTERLSVPIIK